jgi:hypothetical protein
MADDIIDIIQTFEDNFPKTYKMSYDVPEGEQCCGNCRNFIFELMPKELKDIEEYAYFVEDFHNKVAGKCIKASEMVSKLAGYDHSLLMFSRKNSHCMLYDPKGAK